jgi:secreted trypsin-like serine protease
MKNTRHIYVNLIEMLGKINKPADNQQQKGLIITTLCVIIFLTFFSGIIRHDVEEKAYLQLAVQKQFDCVGRIYKKDTTASGSCVLINDRFVLSAAHVFIDSETRPDTIEFNGQKIVAYVPYNTRITNVSDLTLEIKGKKVKVKNLWLHPHYLESLTKGFCDIALLELEKPIKNIAPATLNTEFNELNSDVVGVGFGASGSADRPDLVNDYNKKIAGENVIDSIGGQLYMGYETLLFADFDHPIRTDCNKLGSPTPRPLEYICTGGDSGGGLFRKKANKWQLIGICSGSSTDIDQLMKSGYYGQIMAWTRVSVFNNWIEKQKK